MSLTSSHKQLENKAQWPFLSWKEEFQGGELEIQGRIMQRRKTKL